MSGERGISFSGLASPAQSYIHPLTATTRTGCPCPAAVGYIRRHAVRISRLPGVWIGTAAISEARLARAREGRRHGTPPQSGT